jgi:hypothetical protein
MKYILSLIIFIIIAIPVYSQEDYWTQTNQKQFISFEEYLEAISIEIDIENLLEIIYYFLDNPIDLLRANVSQISEIPGISYFDAYNIYDYVRRDNTITFDAICQYFNFNEYQQ